ncbi:MAG: antitoxin Xre/MbcA/ParS toxin-binding domain-containing protein [Myxococcota bacterium]
MGVRQLSEAPVRPFRLGATPSSLAWRVFRVPTVESDPVRVREAVARGVTLARVKTVAAAYGFNQAELAAQLGLTVRTLDRKRKAGERLGAKASDNLARLVRVFDRAVEVLGEEGRAGRWLQTANPALGGDAPRAWLFTDAGTTEVLRVLGRLEHGVFS